MKKQVSLFTHFGRNDLQKRYARTVHGGRVNKGSRKVERPLATNKPVHLVLRSGQAKGAWSFLAPKNRVAVEGIIREKAKKFGIRIADFANVGSHLHVVVKFSARENFQNFLRAVTCLIPRKVTGARRGVSRGPFWDGLAYTRIVKTSFEERQLKGYLEANRVEASKGSAAREKFLDRFNEWIKQPLEKKPIPPGSYKIGDIIVPPGKWVVINPD